jgi:hypothetical protein
MSIDQAFNKDRTRDLRLDQFSAELDVYQITNIIAFRYIFKSMNHSFGLFASFGNHCSKNQPKFCKFNITEELYEFLQW